MRFAYADPPYLGCCSRYGHRHEPPYFCWDREGAHRVLLEKLAVEFPDGWALSAASTSLRTLLPMCPSDVRIGGWFKSFASFKPNVNPAFAWEPVIFHGGRGGRDRSATTVRDWLCVPITLQKGLTGAKPPQVNRWILDLLGYRQGDEMVDLFPGTAGMAAAVAQTRMAL